MQFDSPYNFQSEKKRETHKLKHRGTTITVCLYTETTGL